MWIPALAEAEAAAWEALVAHEADNVDNTDPDEEMEVTTIVDLVKAVERVSLMVVWMWAEYWKFPRGLVAIILQICQFPRRVVVQGCSSQDV